MFPSKIMSTGGDELNTACYAQDAETQTDLKTTGRTLEQALDVFTQTTHGAIIAEGKTPAVWEGEPRDVCIPFRMINALVLQRWCSTST